MHTVFSYFKAAPHRKLALAIFGFVCIALTRFLYLNTIPFTLTHDEMVYAIQAKSLAVQGTTWDQQLGWFSLQPVDPMYAEWPATTLAPGFWLTSNPLFAAHAMTALLGSGIPILLGILVWQWWGNTRLAVLTVIVAACNPLLWQFSRLGYDALLSSFFYLAGAVLLLQQNRRLVLLSIPVFILGFFQYQAFKLLLIPWILGVLAVRYVYQLKLTKIGQPTSKETAVWLRHNWPQLFVAAVSVALLAAYMVLLLPQQDTANRLSHLIWNNTEYLTEETNTLRRLSLDFPVKTLFINKFTTMIDYVVSHALSVWSPVRLFSHLDPSVNGFAVWRHGLFYLIDAVLLICGGMYLLSRKTTQAGAIVLAGLIVVLSFPAWINTQSEWYELRSFLSYVLLCIPIAAGMEWVLTLQRKLATGALATAYIVLVSIFAIQYFYLYPIYTADMARMIERTTARYLALAHQVEPSRHIYVSLLDENERRYFFAAYLLYSQRFTPETAEEIAAVVTSDEWTFDNITFGVDCIPDTQLSPETLLLYLPDKKLCSQRDNIGVTAATDPTIQQRLAAPLTLAAIADSGAQLRIVGDTVCQPATLNTFIHPTSLADFAIETMESSQFCQTWVTDQNL